MDFHSQYGVREYKNFMISRPIQEFLLTNWKDTLPPSLTSSKQFLDQEITELPHSLIYYIVKRLLVTEESTGLLEEYIDTLVDVHDDIKYFTYKACIALTNANNLDILFQRLIHLLLYASPPPEQNHEYSLLYKSTTNKQLLQSKSYQEAFSDLWIWILFDKQHKSIIDSPSLLNSILYDMNMKILPYFIRPIRLVDFLTAIYDDSYLTAKLLSLHSLFYLMHHYNLDYPSFYQKLYSLLNFDIFHQPYRNKIFGMFELFLSSTHLPLYLVAAFIKRMSRLMLFSPPSSIIWILTFIYKHMKRHEPLREMIHKSNMNHNIYTDSFDMRITDLNQVNAISSSLWEIETIMKNYYNPRVSLLAKRLFYQDEHWNKNHPEYDNSLSYASLLKSSLQISSKTPTILNINKEHPCF